MQYSGRSGRQRRRTGLEIDGVAHQLQQTGNRELVVQSELVVRHRDGDPPPEGIKKSWFRK